MRNLYLSLSDESTEKAQPCDPPNTYPLARRVLGRYAPGTRRASGPVPVIADVRQKNNTNHPMNFTLNSGFPFTAIPTLGIFWFASIWIITAVIHISFALAIFQDSHRMLHAQRRGTFLVGGSIWALATLLGGVITAGIYWVIHHSNLRPTQPPQS